MTKEEIYEAVQKLLFQDSGDLSRDEFSDLLNEVIDDCKTSLNALEEDEEE